MPGSLPCPPSPGAPRALQSVDAGAAVALEPLPAACRREHRVPGPEDARPRWASRPNFPSLLGSAVVTEMWEQVVWGAVRTQGHQRHTLHDHRDPRVKPRGSKGRGARGGRGTAHHPSPWL